MAKKAKLTKSITVSQFENGYWYAEEIKAFAKQIGIRNTTKLRKDQLEELIKAFIRTGKVPPSSKKIAAPTLVKDYELGLKPRLPIINYTSNNLTKQFIESEARKIRPNLKKKSGARYRLNRWREAQLNAGKKITYADLIREYIRLNEVQKPFEKIPVGRYINFLAAYLKNEPNATRKEAIAAWKKLKSLDIPKDYDSWKATVRR